MREVGVRDLIVRDGGRIDTLQLRLFAEIAHEEARVDFDAFDGAAGHAQFDHDPVVGVLVVASCFPSVVPGAGVDEDAWAVDWGGWGEEVGGGGEVVVGAGDDSGV